MLMVLRESLIQIWGTFDYFYTHLFFHPPYIFLPWSPTLKGAITSLTSALRHLHQHHLASVHVSMGQNLGRNKTLWTPNCSLSFYQLPSNVLEPAHLHCLCRNSGFLFQSKGDDPPSLKGLRMHRGSSTAYHHWVLQLNTSRKPLKKTSRQLCPALCRWTPAHCQTQAVLLLCEQ